MTASKRRLLLVAIAVLPLLLIESCARLVTTIYNDIHPQASDDDWLRYAETFGWLPAPGFVGRIGGRVRKFDAGGLLVDDTKKLAATGRRRIVVVGDQVSFGTGIDTDSTYAADIERIFPNVDVINLSVPDYSSYQGLTRLETQGLALKPDLIIAQFSCNDGRAVKSPAERDGPARFQAIYEENQHHAYDWFYSYRLLKALLGPREPGKTPVDLLTMGSRVPIEQYRDNLRRIARLGAEHKIPVVFLVLSDNPELEPSSEGLAKLAKGDFPAAEILLRPRLDDYSKWLALRAWLIAQEGAHVGDAEKARTLRMRPIAFDFYRGAAAWIEFPQAYQAAAREAAQSEGALLADAVSLLRADDSVFLDHCRVNERGHERLAALLASTIRQVWK